MARKYTLKNSPDTESPLLKSLNPPQREAASHQEGPLLILAGAGSGKTRVMTHRMAWLIAECGAHPEQILAMTFTNKACAEMRHRVEALVEDPQAADLITISTFHSLCARLLRRHAKKIGLNNDFVIYDDSDQISLARRVLEEMGRSNERVEARRLIAVVEGYKNDGLTPTQAHERAFDQGTEQDAEFYETYQDALKAANCVDFGELILGVLELFRKHPDIAQSYSMQWRYIMVDEFQDTNPAQYELLQHFTTYHKNLAVVGDDDQAIYRWRGATIQNILGFEEDFSDAKVIKLEQNYRSTKRILRAANHVISKMHTRREKELWTDNLEGADITYFTATDDREEAQYVANRVAQAVRAGQSYSDFAIFFRKNAQARAFEEQLRFEGLPYQVVGGMSFYAREEIKDILAYLKVALNPANEVDLLRVLNKPTRGIGNTSIEKFRVAAALPQVGGVYAALRIAAGEEAPEPVELVEPVVGGWLPGLAPPPSALDDPAVEEIRGLKGRTQAGVEEFVRIVEVVRQRLKEKSLSYVLTELINEVRYFEFLTDNDPERADDRKQNVMELLNAVSEFESEFTPDRQSREPRGVQTLRAFLDRSALIQSTDDIDDRGAITLMTVHGSKGLEFDTVFLVGMEEDMFPSARDEDPEEMDEERRLAYVAITRAERQLTITNAKRRRVFGQIKDTRPSRFVLDIDEDLLAIDPRSSSRTVHYGKSRPEGRAWMPGAPVAGRDMWEFDQTVTEQDNLRHFNRMKAAAPKPQYDEYSQVNPYDEEPVWDVSEMGLDDADEDAIKGRTVTHPSFGVGRILAVSGKGDSAKLTIKFPTVGEKKVIRKFVQLL